MTGATRADASGGASVRETDRRWMERALELAGRGWGRVHPNPLVGAVVAAGDRLLGEGWHGEFGGPHAEVRALEEAGAAAREGTLYVTLEPCAHHGKTPPCTEAILEAGVRRVVVACRDPDPEAGGGAARLEASGVEVTVGVGAERARTENAAFLWSRVTGRPYVALKYALSLDARLSRREGERTAVTGDEAGEEVHRLRAGHGAVLVGRRTAAVDDPLLTPRGALEPRRPPIRVVLDPGLRLSPDSRLARTSDRGPVWVACGPDAPGEARAALRSRGVEVVEVPRPRPHELDLRALLEELGRAGRVSVLVEGGGQVGASFLRGGLVNRMYLFYAPVVFGEEGVEAFPGPAPEPPRGAWRPVDRRAVGSDTLVVLDDVGSRTRLREAS